MVPPGYHLALTVRGKDYEFAGPLDEHDQSSSSVVRGIAGMTHTDPADRPPEIFDTTVRLHTSPTDPSYLLLPVIP